eukprot:962437-Alexandrium_andersonii.AAC.1
MAEWPTPMELQGHRGDLPPWTRVTYKKNGNRSQNQQPKNMRIWPGLPKKTSTQAVMEAKRAVAPAAASWGQPAWYCVYCGTSHVNPSATACR